MLDALTEAEIQAYQSQGFILRRSVFSRVELSSLMRRLIDWRPLSLRKAIKAKNTVSMVVDLSI